MTDLKVLEYNVLNGFVSREDMSFRQERLDKAKEVVSDYSPDILVLTEAIVFEDGNGLGLGGYKEAFGYKHAFNGASGPGDFVRSVVVLSNYSLEGVDYSVPGFGFSRISLDVEWSKINLDVVFPRPQMSDEQKALFFKSVLRDFEIPYILAGDFNSVSPEDDYDSSALERGFDRVVEGKGKEIANNFLKMKSFKEVLDEGLKDTFKVFNERGFTVPTSLISDDLETRMRVDFIFCSEDFEVLDSGIIQNEKTEKASDHYPVYAKLRL